MKASQKHINNAGVILLCGKREMQHTKFLVQCPQCGNVFYMWDTAFYRGINNCECNKTHYHRDYPVLYQRWKGMKQRALNLNNPDKQKYYTNITICDDWNDFESFKTWALNNGFAPNLSLDRIDNSLGYGPSNCRWVSMKVQNNNKRNNVLFTIDETQYTAAQLARKYNINYHTFICYWYKHGTDQTLKHFNIWK